MKVIAIAAMNDRNVIGRQNQIPWKCKEDMNFFKEMTSGHAVAMGRKTAESLGKPLPNRYNLVLSSSGPKNVEVGDGRFYYFPTVDDLMFAAKATDQQKLFIIGGAEIYALFADQVDELLLTRIADDSPGDTLFPLNAYQQLFDVGDREKIQLSERAVVTRFYYPK